MEAQLEPLQNDATSGAGKTLTVPDPERIFDSLVAHHTRVAVLAIRPEEQQGWSRRPS
jgi:hypothetical protein